MNFLSLTWHGERVHFYLLFARTHSQLIAFSFHDQQPIDIQNKEISTQTKQNSGNTPKLQLRDGGVFTIIIKWKINLMCKCRESRESRECMCVCVKCIIINVLLLNACGL